MALGWGIIRGDATRFGPNSWGGRGSGSDWDSGMELGRPHVLHPGLCLGYRAALCPDSTNRSLLNGLILYEATCSKAQDAVLETGMSQGLLSRSVEKGPYRALVMKDRKD